MSHLKCFLRCWTCHALVEKILWSMWLAYIVCIRILLEDGWLTSFTFALYTSQLRRAGSFCIEAEASQLEPSFRPEPMSSSFFGKIRFVFDFFGEDI